MDDNDFSDVLASAPEALAGDAADHAVAAPGYFFRLRGEQFGPVVIKELQDLIDGGTMTASDRIRRDDSAAWIPCGEIETLTFPRAVETAAAVRTPTPKQPVSPELSLADFPADFLETIDANETEFSHDPKSSFVDATHDSNDVTVSHEAQVPKKARRSREASPQPIGKSANDPSPDWWDALASPAPEKRDQSAEIPMELRSGASVQASTISTPPPTGRPVPEEKHSKKAGTKPARKREPLNFRMPSSPLVYVLAGLIAIFTAVCFWPESAAIAGFVSMDGEPVPVGSITLKPKNGKSLTISIVQGRFQAADGAKFSDGQSEIVVVIGDPFGSPAPALNESPAFAGLNGAKYNGVIEARAGSKINVSFSADEVNAIANNEGMPTEAF